MLVLIGGVFTEATIEDDEVQQAMRCMDDLCCTISLTHAGMTKERYTHHRTRTPNQSFHSLCACRAVYARVVRCVSVVFRIRAIVFGLGGMYILTGLLRRLRRVALLQRKGSELVSLLLGDISSKGALTDVETSSVLPLIRTLGKTYHHYAPWGPNGKHARTHHRTRTRTTAHAHAHDQRHARDTRG